MTHVLGQGQGKRLEAISARLGGGTIEYRSHVQDRGWLGWAKDGDSAGTSGHAKRAEAVEVVILPKDAAAPGSTTNAYVSK